MSEDLLTREEKEREREREKERKRRERMGKQAILVYACSQQQLTLAHHRRMAVVQLTFQIEESENYQ